MYRLTLSTLMLALAALASPASWAEMRQHSDGKTAYENAMAATKAAQPPVTTLPKPAASPAPKTSPAPAPAAKPKAVDGAVAPPQGADKARGGRS